MRPLFSAAGIDYDQWKALTIVALKLDFRTSSLGQSQFRREASQILGLIAQFVFYSLAGGTFAFLVWFSRDLFFVGTVVMTYTMFVVGTAVLIDHHSAFASPLDYGILGFRPVTSRTYFAVRLTNVLVYTTVITTAAAWLPIASLFLRYGTSVGAAAVLAFYLCSTGTVLAILLGYAWVLRVAGPDVMKRALSYLQLAMSFIVYGGYFFIAGQVSRNVATSLTMEKTPWLLLYPATWFTAYLELAAGERGALEILPAAASVIALVLMASALNSRLSLEYSERLAALTTAVQTTPVEAAKPSWIMTWFRAGEARAVALLVRSQFRNDQRFRMGVLAVLPMTIVYLVMALRSGPIQDPFLDRRGESGPMGGFMPVTMALMMFPSLLKVQLTHSDSFRASWIFFASPANRMAIVRSSKNVLMAFFLIPYLAFLVAVYSYFVGHIVHVAVHIGLQGLLGHLVLQVAVLIDPALPFSRPMQKGRNSVLMIGFLIIIAMASTALDAFSSSVYASVGATAGVVAGIVGASVIVERLTRARVERQTRSLEFEG
jgi:hypothetical protein